MFQGERFPNDAGLTLSHISDDGKEVLSSFTAIFHHHKDEKPKGPGYMEEAHTFKGPHHQYATIVIDSETDPHHLLHHGEVESTEIDWGLRPFIEKWLGTEDGELVDDAIHTLNVAWGFIYKDSEEKKEEVPNS